MAEQPTLLERNVGVVGRASEGILTGQRTASERRFNCGPHAQQLDEQPDDDNRKRHDEADGRMARHQGDEDAYGCATLRQC